MTDRPILFSAPMIKALLAGTKTQTRRVLKPQPDFHNVWQCEDTLDWWQSGHGEAGDDPIHIRIQRGDRLWVRESGHLLREAFDHDPRSGEDVWRDAGFCHAADGAIVPARAYDTPLSEWADDCGRISRPSIHMPRWASRLTLSVSDVRVERLQDISEEDATAEGAYVGKASGRVADNQMAMNLGMWFATGRAWYADLWDRINGEGAWARNDWVVAYSFEIARRNIDAEG